jgi:hypothetical protein
VGEILGVFDEALGRWLIGRCGLMLINGGLTAAGLWLLGMPLALTLGLLAGLLNFIPELRTCNRRSPGRADRVPARAAISPVCRAALRHSANTGRLRADPAC